MSCANIVNINTIATKCGEIIITVKKNAKNSYSFNCWFCNTTYIQMKKFTLHLEQEHVADLEQKSYNEPEADNNLTETIKVEHCGDDMGSEMDEDNLQNSSKVDKKIVLSPKILDPLETVDNELKESSTFAALETKPFVEIAEKDSCFKDEPHSEEIEMHDLSDDELFDDLFCDENHSSDSDYNIEDCTNETVTKTVKERKKANEKELILTLIDAYYKNPPLWNTSLVEKCSHKEKEDLLQSITDDVNAKLNIKLKLYMVKKKLNFICKQYEMEFERQMNENEKVNVEESPQLWFYENLSFLKSVTENKLKRVKKKKTSNPKVKPLNDSVLCELIDIYQNYNSLWDVNHIAYTVKDKRQETLQIMVDDINKKMNLPLDTYKLEKHINYIHKSFAMEKQLKLECEAKQLEFEPSCSYYNKCVFLEKHQGPFKCPNCHDIIETYNDFQLHKSQHDGSIPFKCQECGMGFQKIANFTLHAKRHLRVFKFHCNICGKGYPFNAELDLHMRSHTGAQPYLCSVCGEGFRTAISYDNHIRRHEKRFKYSCHICKKGFNHMTRLNDHVKAHLNVRDVICTVCGKGFTSRKYLNHHKRIHEGKNYTCNICGKSFAQDAGLRAHKKYHGTPIGISSIQKEQNKYNF